MGECCLYEGTYTLTCADSANDGWHGGFINIAGTEYCGDFTGWGADSTTRTVEIGSCVEDACGVCDGDSSSCADACGVPNGSSDTCLDACGVPNGASDTCECVVTTVDIWVQNYGDEMEWTIASCSGGPYAGGSADEVSYTETCCLGEGTFTLTCTDAYGDGWHGGDITIAGTDYCSDFVGWGADSTTRTVEIGSCVEDVCGVCDGDSSSCADACGVANGDSSSCADACGVVNGDSSTCGECVVTNVYIWVDDWGQEMTWSIGNACSGGPYASVDYVSYTEECCLYEGTYTLTCADSANDGWHGGFINIAGTEYC